MDEKMEFWFCDKDAWCTCTCNIKKIIDGPGELRLMKYEKDSVEKGKANIYQVLFCIIYLGVPDQDHQFADQWPPIQ